MEEIIITGDTTLEGGIPPNTRLIIRASHVTIDGNGAALKGPGIPGEPASFEGTGAAIESHGCVNVTLRNIKAEGFESGLALTDCRCWVVEECDFSDNYHNPQHGWGELPARGGIILRNTSHSVFHRNQARNVWDALNLVGCDDNTFTDNDFSHCSNVCAKLWTSSRNRFVRNNLSYGLRIDRSIGEVHARDSTGVLIESASNDNYWYRNDITNGGDGVFIRVLNGWISTGNTFIENDTSYANNNCVECWSPGNVFIRNKANHGSYGFWMGGSDRSVIIGNECAYNGLPEEHANAMISEFMGFAGIIFAGGPGSHTIVEGNHCHHNGSGIVIQGDVKSKGSRWNIHHWIIQNNWLEDNRRAIYAEYADWVFIGPNDCRRNAEGDFLKDVTRLMRRLPASGVATAPLVRVSGPTRASVGRPATFDASGSSDPQDKPLTFEWDLGGTVSDRASVTHAFDKPGFYRVGVTVSNGTFAGLGYRDLLVVAEPAQEIGTELEADRWSAEVDGAASSSVRFSNEPDALVGNYSLCFSPKVYNGETVRVTLHHRDEGWDLSGKQSLVFWVKVLNPNIPIEDGDNRRVSIELRGFGGAVRFTAKHYGAFFHGSYSEARSYWHRVEVPLHGESADWSREAGDAATLDRVESFSLAVWTSGNMPFTMWLDGMAFE